MESDPLWLDPCPCTCGLRRVRQRHTQSERYFTPRRRFFSPARSSLGGVLNFQRLRKFVIPTSCRFSSEGSMRFRCWGSQALGQNLARSPPPSAYLHVGLSLHLFDSFLLFICHLLSNSKMSGSALTIDSPPSAKKQAIIVHAADQPNWAITFPRKYQIGAPIRKARPSRKEVQTALLSANSVEHFAGNW